MMNNSYQLDDSPDTQAFSPEAIMSADAELPKNHIEESQSILTSLKNINKNKSDFASNSIEFGKRNFLHSQQLFTETETNLDHDVYKGKTKNKPTDTELYEDESQSISTSSKKRFRTEDYSNKDTKKDINESEIMNESHLKHEDITPSGVNCPDCIFDKELDKRNYYFGNLLIGELQFLPPCMRSEAYVTILQYVDSLKRKHRNKNNSCVD